MILHDGKEIKASGYEVYVGPQKWVNAKDGEIHIGALVSGKQADGDRLYVARANSHGGTQMGKVRRGLGASLIPHDGEEHRVT